VKHWHSPVAKSHIPLLEQGIYSLVAAVVMAIVHEGEVCVEVIKFPVQVICDKAGEPEWVWMLFSNGKMGNEDIVIVIVAAFFVESTLETTQVAVSTLGKEEIAAVQAEFDKMVPSASNVTS
tara:strand:+ start:353 stop:718 length:366 start_codon:yes stop_codon:yes gene_type:complete